MSNFKGRLQRDEKRGVIYFFEETTGECLLRIEGLPEILGKKQIDVHLVYPGCEHHHEHCGGHALKDAPKDDAIVCAVKIPRFVAETKG